MIEKFSLGNLIHLNTFEHFHAWKYTFSYLAKNSVLPIRIFLKSLFQALFLIPEFLLTQAFEIHEYINF